MSEVITYKGNTAYMFISSVSASTFQAKGYPVNSPATNTGPLSQDDLEEQEWDALLSKPHVRRGLRRLAAEVRQQIAAGEIEEGGFVIE